ncbi:MAG TPA: DUF3524 domain-containing protein [Acidimicrobiia bacterium]|nr:DUF3524 domain-containing protein [Acidimicrobiia bacterium]
MSLDGSVLIVEPYFGGSHRAWAEGLAEYLEAPVELLTLPARWWKWRMRGAAVTLAERCADLTTRPAVVLASDMLDLAAFRTFSRPHLGDVPFALYFHESQLTYPDSPQMEPDMHFAVTNWLSALAADRVLFNSNHHRDVFFAEIPRLLRHFPDFTHEHLVDSVEDRSAVLEVGVDLGWLPVEASPRRGPVRLLWNHRWEHDKDPATFFAAIDNLDAEGHSFEVVVCGENFRLEPSEFDEAARRHPARIVHMGHLPLADYRRHLLEADVVVSTARQEFFGVAVVEAVAAGCFPILPDRLSYPGLVPRDWHDACLYPVDGLVERLRWAVTHPAEVRDGGHELSASFRRFGWDRIAPLYDKALAALV